MRALADLDPEDAPWSSLDSLLLAEIVDTLRFQLWAQADRRRRGRRPEPIERPGRRRARRASKVAPDVMARRLIEQRERLNRRRRGEG